jgi:NAD(P)-dependent dehydrogenase (short-subunit alcohol dehydrogenase family)
MKQDKNQIHALVCGSTQGIGLAVAQKLFDRPK